MPSQEANSLEKARYEAVLEMHKQYLEALRQREQEIVRFIVILLPALGGFLWVLNNFSRPGSHLQLQAASIGAIFLLTLGAVYSLALSFNYRSVLMQLSKIELTLGLNEYIIVPWSRKKCKRTTSPPEILLVFYVGYIIALLIVTFGAIFIIKERDATSLLLIALIISAFTITITHCSYHRRLKRYFSLEPITSDEE